MSEQKQYVKNLILNTAETIFAENGYEGAAMRDIAAKAGINTALIYYHFESKEHLYKSIFDLRLSAFNESLASLPVLVEASAFERLSAYVMAHIANIRDNFYFHRILNSELLSFRNQFFKTTIMNSIKASIDKYREVLRQGVATGEFRQVDPDLFLMTLFYLLHQVMGRSPLASELLNLEEIPEEQLTNRIRSFMYQQLHGTETGVTVQ